MAEFCAGLTMVLQWVWSGGTTSLAADYRTCTWTPTIDLVDTSAGADQSRTRIATIKDATAAFTLVNQSGGTAIKAALSPGIGGTLIIGPEGTATGKTKITMPALCNGATIEYPYADLSIMTCTFTGNGAWSESTW